MQSSTLEQKHYWIYQQVAELVQNEQLPAMLVNLDAFDYNVAQFAERARNFKKKIRIASKSLRLPELIRRAMDSHPDVFQGIMAYSPLEAVFLCEQGFDDILVAYPCVEAAGIVAVAEKIRLGKNIIFMVDHPLQLAALKASWPGESKIPVCIDIDMSYHPVPFLHLGVRRSSLCSAGDFERFLRELSSDSVFSLKGVMGYEAQIAGMGEKNPFSPLINPIKSLIKSLSKNDVYAKRRELTAVLARKGLRFSFFNGGGSGSLASTSAEPWISEVTVGSGLLQSHLFDYYRDNFSVPALSFALRVTRQPAKDIVTCQSGGFIASGESGWDKSPIPFLPSGLKLINMEGCGEVQTPLITSGADAELKIGDPVFFRPAKAGEIAEHFNEYLCFSGESMLTPLKTYRGLGQRFF